MDAAAFEHLLAESGYGEAARVEWEPGLFNDTHTHDFDALILVVSGAITISRAESDETFGPGETCALARGTPHTELVGDEGVVFLAGRR